MTELNQEFYQLELSLALKLIDDSLRRLASTSLVEANVLMDTFLDIRRHLTNAGLLPTN